ncbi:hypothetical protein C0993_005996 [Termitomyces sp. T159_Od127]|nr:hypothetical protein C0993_005996 [Termitomyces sp. T159_Od127]
MFPATGVFAGLGPMGVSMFFLSTVLAQLVYTCGGSKFAGANGSMMIEVVPFFHILANDIRAQIGEDRAREVIATTLAAYTLSSILTGPSVPRLPLRPHPLTPAGLTFFLLGALRLGTLIGFFPRHILVGCIGGVGAFLLRTGFAVSMRVDEDVDWGTFERMFMDRDNLVLWAVPLALAVLLRVVTAKWTHQLVMPLYFLLIPIAFYAVVLALGANLADLRSAGWIFDMGSRGSEAWYKFYQHWDFTAIRYRVLLDTLPTQFALLFFNILHPPLNVPALSVMVVGALIFVLGIDLVKEALWDTRHRTTRLLLRGAKLAAAEYTLAAQRRDRHVDGAQAGCAARVPARGVEADDDFEVARWGISCWWWVGAGADVSWSLRTPRPLTPLLPRPPPRPARPGFLFFGTISHVEDTIREIIDGPEWHRNPVRFLVLDLTLVAGVDMSSAEAFVRMHRFLSAKAVRIVFCGFARASAVGRALESVGVLGKEDVERFETFGDAMEWTENVYLRAWYVAQKHEAASTAFAFPGRHNRGYDRLEPPFLSDPLIMTPRRSYLRDVGNRTIANGKRAHSAVCTASPFPAERIAAADEYANEPLNTLVRAFASEGEADLGVLRAMGAYLERVALPADTVLWAQGDAPDGLYVVEAGVLRASYRFAEHVECVQESMVPGTVAGELSALSGLPRNATVTVERAATLWRMSVQGMERLEREEPVLARAFVRLVLRGVSLCGLFVWCAWVG